MVLGILILSYNILKFTNYDKSMSYYSLTRTTLNQREIHLIWTIFAICFSFTAFTIIPNVVNDILVDLEILEGSSFIEVPIDCLYWLQYSLNFFIYAARSDQYRKAYIFFLQRINCIPHKNQWGWASTQTLSKSVKIKISTINT